MIEFRLRCTCESGESSPSKRLLSAEPTRPLHRAERRRASASPIRGSEWDLDSARGAAGVGGVFAILTTGLLALLEERWPPTLKKGSSRLMVAASEVGSKAPRPEPLACCRGRREERTAGALRTQLESSPKTRGPRKYVGCEGLEKI